MYRQPQHKHAVLYTQNCAVAVTINVINGVTAHQLGDYHVELLHSLTQNSSSSFHLVSNVIHLVRYLLS